MNERESEIIQAIEACRAEANDWEALEGVDGMRLVAEDAVWRQRCERAQAWDRTLSQALHDVPIPHGLGGRVLAALEHEVRPLSSVVTASGVSYGSCGGTDSGRRSRRWVVGLAGSAISAALIGVMVVWGWGTRPVPQPTPEFAHEVIQWSEVVAGGEWSTDFSVKELNAYPFDDAIRAAPRRWTWFATPYHPRTVVYDLTAPRGERTYVFCIPAARPSVSLPSTPPLRPFSTTGGVSMGTWQRDAQIYVLAAQGGESRYRRLLQSTIVLRRVPAPPTSSLPCPV